MIRNKIVFVLFGLLFFSFLNSVFAQDSKCGFDDYLKYNFKEKKDSLLDFSMSRLASQRPLEEVGYIIPVVFHIIHDNVSGYIGGSRNANVSDDQILSQLEVINEDFGKLNADTALVLSMFQNNIGNAKIEFCLASTDPEGNFSTGINRVYSDQLPFNKDIDDVKLKKTVFWPTDQYLNIWVTDISNALGYSYFPYKINLDGVNAQDNYFEIDGVVVDYKAFGKGEGTVRFSGNKYDKGRTLTHEIGHWLGLLHIWGNNYSCSVDDFCDDTPLQSQSNLNFLSEHACGDILTDCNVNTMYQNFMDYTPDACMSLFTNDQATRMRYVLENDVNRKKLKESIGCCGQVNKLSVPYQTSFEDQLWTSTNFNENLELIDLSEKGLLISPSLYLSNSDFYYFFEYQGDLKNIKVEYKYNCSEEWIEYSFINQEKLNQFVFAQDDLHRVSLDFRAPRKGIYQFRFSIEGSMLKVSNFKILDDFQENNIDVSFHYSEGELLVSEFYKGYADVNFKLYDVRGRLVEQIHREQVLSDVYRIDLSFLSSGLYFVVAELAGVRNVTKIVVP